MKIKTSLLGTVAALALAVVAVAQTTQTVSGTIVSSTPTQVVIKTDDGRQMTFNVDTQSTVPAGLNQGTAVTVNYHDMGGGTLHAAQVTTSSAGTMPSTATNPDTTANPPSTRTNPSTTANPPSSTYNPPTTTANPPTTTNDTYANTTRTTAPAAQEPMESNRTTRARRMPSTASPLPLIGLAGLLSLTAGLGLRAARRSA